MDHEWLIDAWLWWMKSRGWWPAVAAIFALLTALPFFVWLKRARSYLGLAFIILGATFMLNLAGIRPQMITFVLFFAVFEIVRKRVEWGRDYLWLMPVIFFIWANLHGGFAVGLVFAGLSMMLEHFFYWFKSSEINKKQIARDSLILAASVASTLINPYGFELYRELYRVMLSSDTAKYIAEWQPALSTYILSAVVLISVYAAFSLLGIFRKLYNPALYSGSLAALLLFLKSVRHGPFFLVCAMPFISASLDRLEEIIFTPNIRGRRQLGLKIIFAVLLLALAGFGHRVYRVENFQFPAGAVEYLKSMENPGEIRLFNEYGWGGYLIYHIPAIKVFIDGRMPHWQDDDGNGAMKDFVKAYYSDDESSWKEVFRKYGINTVLLVNNQKDETGLRAKYRKFMLENKYTKWIAGQIYNLAVKKEALDLGDALIKNKWTIIYQDDESAILGCENNSCYGN